MPSFDRSDLEEAARLIAEADALVIGAGAGMGVDSGLPDFRGDEGFWNAYPPFRHLGLSFIDLANPSWFEREPALAWGFYGHRLNLYRQTQPHPGFDILLRWAAKMEHGAFVYTSNVDGQFQTAGFGEDRVVECHGSILHLQAVEPGDEDIWRGHDVVIDVDEVTMRARAPLPRTATGALARPNILMFGDWNWLDCRTQAQESAFQRWLSEADPQRLVVVECGAGTAIPSVRFMSERQVSRGARLIRINPRESHHPRGELGFAGGALPVLRAIAEALQART